MRDQALTLVLARKVTIIILVSQWHEIDFTMWNSQIHGHGVLGAAGSIWGPRANEESSLGTQVWKYKSTSYSYNCSPNEWSNTQHLFYLLYPWGVSKTFGSEDILKSILYHSKLKYWLLLCMQTQVPKLGLTLDGANIPELLFELIWKTKCTCRGSSNFGRNFDANLLKKWTFENLWNHFEVLLHKVSREFHDFPSEPKITKCRDSL